MTIPFFLQSTDDKARIGQLHTPHGVIDTPAFMPVGTAATVKGMMPEAVAKTGAQVILGNTYHLMLRPGAERVARLGGLHRFMNWSGPILTDSGGFQVMSLAKLRKISEEGVRFQSHLDGESIMLTPERSIEIQHLLGADITMMFDECTPFPATEKQAADSMQLSMRWGKRSKEAFVKLKEKSQMCHPARVAGSAVRPYHTEEAVRIPQHVRDDNEESRPLLFGIVQGSIYPNLRAESASALQEIGFDGYAIGGLAVGEGQELMFEVLDFTLPHLPASKPRYLMGVGKPDDIIGAVARGVDMFDCVIPTRSGRNARAYTWLGEWNIRNARFADDAAPLDSNCACTACRHYSRAYLNHLFKADEMLGPILLTEHNVTFYQDLMRGIREAIKKGMFKAYSDAFLSTYHAQKE